MPARARWWERNPACWSWKIPTRTELDRLQAKHLRECRRFLPHLPATPLPEDKLRWMAMGEMHRDRCAVCGRRCSQSYRTDHDHKTGLVRGYLCPSCNTTEGFRGSDEGIFAMYRLLNPAMMCGVREIHQDHWERW
jgi:hypothetical protein